ncbi:hypothetical protein PSHT_04293 [Puccinia striiformis]|uniref:Uncharacterized protein n=1 Tax=Puccinia striiformis TaxID=27350 RepID=A0A2S4WDE5_9BASI|nr:hypothetical protein PSHT_04293 [Puccinia striiformis]
MYTLTGLTKQEHSQSRTTIDQPTKQDASHNTNHAQDIGHATLAHHLTSTEPPQAMNVSTSSGALNVTAVDHPNHIPAPTSITNTQADTPDIKLEKPTTSDPALDEDAPHEDDDDDDADDADDNDDEEGGNEQPSSTNPPIPNGHSYQEAAHIDSQRTRHSWPQAQLYDHHQIDQKPEIPPSTTKGAADSSRKRKRNSDQSGGNSKTSGRASSRPKQTPRIKSAEQLEREALIEQQNPNATKNELRSLKLRALHAIRITERELNMPEAEKQRRLRLREYVRHKREEERRIKRSSKPVDTADAEIKSGSQSSSQSTKTKKIKAQITNQPTISQTTDPRLLSISSHPELSQLLPTPALINGVSHQLSPLGFHSGPTDNSSQKPTKNGQQNSSRRKSGTTPRAKLSVTSLEAEIKKQNPHASPTQLKSLKLRALHADRIAVREENMSEKEKTRRQKLREYMRRRRDEERVEKGQEPTQLSTAQETNTALDSVLAYRRSLESHPHHQSNDGRMTALSGTAIVPEGMNADDRLAAFSMMELTNNYHHQHHHQQFSPQTHAVQPTTSNLHLHPLFQVPIGQPPSLDTRSGYECSMHTGYPPLSSEQWTHHHQLPAIEPTNQTSTEGAEKALHAAIEEAIYMKPHHHLNHHQIPINGHQYPRPDHDHQSLEGFNRLNHHHHHHQLDHDHQILGIDHAHELALIAAAAAEVEHAHLVHASTSSTSNSNSNSTDPSSLLLR